MILELKGKQYHLRATMRAIDEAQEKESISFSELNGIVDTSKLLYYCAKHGMRHEGEPFKISVADWLDMIELKDMPQLTDAVRGLMPEADEEKKRGG